MRYSQKWWVIVALLFAFALTVSVLTAQTETPPSAVNAPSSAEVQADSVGAQASSDEPEQKQPTLELNRDMSSADVENERRFNELRRELLDGPSKNARLVARSYSYLPYVDWRCCCNSRLFWLQKAR